MYSIGLDISKSTINVYVPFNDLDLVIENNLKSLKSLYSKLKKHYKKDIDKLVFVYEPTGNYSSVIKKFAANKNIKCFIVNPKQSSNFSKAIGQRNKNDVNDARMLSQMIVTASKEQIKVPVIKQEIEEIKELITYYQFLIKQKSQNKNHLESLIAKDGISKLIQRIKKEIKLLEQKEKEILLEIKKVIAKDEKLQEAFINIQSIKSVGEVSAIVLLHHFIQYSNANQKEIISLAGLDPIEKSSGTSIKGRTRISKAGSKLCRSVLFMASLNATQYNEELKRFYNRLKDNGKHTTVAQIAVMRKIVVIAHSIYKNNEIYDEERFKRYL
ncbi:MAG: IS110 family transposase [Arcobacter sp.]|uniref:IS110 family transposase n=1 Tax=Arcobacter sp. TaxID=1872629 RepID=UPI003AFF97EE